MTPLLRRLKVPLLLVLLGSLSAVAVVEVGLRVQIAREKPGDLELTALSFPPPYKEACEQLVTLGHLIRPSVLPELIYELKPNLDTCYHDARVKTNSDGLRADKDFVRPKPPNTYRVLLLGDSQTFGQGVESEQTFGHLLEVGLNARSKGPVVEVINSGVDGYNTAQEAAYLLARGMDYEPDCVLILFIGNDLQLPTFLDTKRDPRALDELYVWALLRDVLSDGRQSRVPYRYRSLVGMPAYRRALTRIAEVAKEHSIKVINLYDPAGRLAALDDPKAWEEVDRLQAELGITAREFQMPSTPDYWISEQNQHLNARGHAEIARQLLGGSDFP